MPQLAFSLVLGNVLMASAQMDYGLPQGIKPASVRWGPQAESPGRYASIGDFTNQGVTLCSVPAPKDEPDSGLSYSVPPSQQRRDAESNEPSLASRVHLADLVRTAPAEGWQISVGGVLSYTTRNQRWHIEFRYNPDLSMLREDYDHRQTFSVIWQYRFRKRNPAN
jgi:hypothetical protein